SDFSNVGTNLVVAAGGNASANLTIGPYSIVVLSQTPVTPALSFIHTNGAPMVCWPANYSAWSLETATNVSAGASWSTVPASQYQTNGGFISASVTSSN